MKSPFWFLVAVVALAPARQTQNSIPNGVDKVRKDLVSLQSRLDMLKAKGGAELSRWLPDTEWYAKGVDWGLRYEPPAEADLKLMRRALTRCAERLERLDANQHPWDEKRGRVARAYRSEVDGSVQPYGLIIPQSYRPGTPTRLDVVLHGSTRPVGMSELHYVMPFDEGDSGGDAPTDHDYIELYPLGRVENCYRWAGEADVFEAIEDVCKHYSIDRDQIVLRGMSMGASGTWHLGLKHPDRFVALGPYCGYVDTHRFSETPGMNFVKVGPLPEHQELGLHMLDSVDYAANAGIVPVVAAIGEKDPFFQAHVIMGEALRAEGLPFTNLISPGTGHVQEPKTWGEQMRQIGAFARTGLVHRPRHIRFVTWTLKYSRCHWLEILRLGAHYRRAEIDATLDADGSVIVAEPKNFTRFALFLSPTALRVGGAPVRIPANLDGKRGLVVALHSGTWAFAGYKDTDRAQGKRPGAQGPIDDAFTRPFLCVRGTGKAWNPAVAAWADANFKRFAYEWARYFRGDLPVKDDTAVTLEDRKNCNLILFGDPGSNRILRDSLPKLPVRWTEKDLVFGSDRYPATDHAPALIAPSPYSRDRYMVVNSGHTFHESELSRLNYLLFPRLGDWAIFKVTGSQPTDITAPLNEQQLKAGFFNEDWRVSLPARQ